MSCTQNWVHRLLVDSVVRKYVDAFNRGDAAAMATASDNSGPTPTPDWYKRVFEGKQQDVSDCFIALGEPLQNNVTGDNAYVVVPGTMTFKLCGEQIMQTGAMFTVGLCKLSDEWRIVAWDCATGTPSRLE